MLELFSLVIVAGLIFIATISIVVCWLFATHTDRIISDKWKKYDNERRKEES